MVMNPKERKDRLDDAIAKEYLAEVLHPYIERLEEAQRRHPEDEGLVEVVAELREYAQAPDTKDVLEEVRAEDSE